MLGSLLNVSLKSKQSALLEAVKKNDSDHARALLTRSSQEEIRAAFGHSLMAGNGEVCVDVGLLG